MTDLYIFGAGGHGHDILAMLDPEGPLHFGGFFDDYKQIGPNKVLGTWTRYIKNISSWNRCAIGLNWPRQRYELIQRLEEWSFASIIHNKADLGYEPNLGKGIVIGANTSLGYRSRIGDHVHIGANVAIHRGKIGEYSTICPGATICGDVKIGIGVTIGAGAVVSNLVNIGDWVTVGAGAVVIDDVDSYATVIGNPARIR